MLKTRLIARYAAGRDPTHWLSFEINTDESVTTFSSLQRVIHQRKYPQRVNSSEVVSALNHQRATAAMKHMASSFAKLEKFEGVDFKRWQKKMHFMLSSMSVVYVLTTPMPNDGGENPTVEQVRKRAKWDNDDYDDDVAWWVDSGANVHLFKDRCWFKTYESLNDGSILHMGNESTALVHGRGCVDLRLNIVFDNIDSAFMSTSKLNDSILWHTRLGHVHFKRMQDISNEALDKLKVFKTKVELQQGSLIKRFKTDGGGEYMDTLYFQSVVFIHKRLAPLTPQQNGISERKNRVLKEMVNSMLSYSGLSQGFWGEAMAVVRLPDPKLKTLGERGIECIFVGYAEHSKAFRFYVIEPNDFVAINSIIESRDAIFDEHKFSFVPRPSQRSLVKGTEDSGGLVVPEKTFDEIVQGMRALGCKWIFKRKLNVDGTVEKFKARLVIQGFKQKSRIDRFDTYAPVARISTIRLLISMASIHSLIIYQMDVKTAFLNGELEEEVYMNQPLGFVLSGNENKVCKLVKSLYRLKQAPKQWHQKFDEVILSNGYLCNQADKCVYSKFDEPDKGVAICLYVDDMLIFGTDQVQVDLTKEFLSSRFSMKDMGEADVILGIRIKHKSNGIAISQSYYIEKVLKKFNYSDCIPVSTPLDTCEKLMPNKGLAVSQLEYSRVIGCLMYAMTCTRPDIAFVVGKLSRPIYSGYPLVLKGYTDASWISNTEDNSSTSGWLWQPLDTPNSLIRKLGTEFQLWKANIQRAEAHVLQIIQEMCLEPAERRMKLLTSQCSIVGICSYRYLGWRYGVYTLTQIVVKEILVADELQRVNFSGSETLE
ncbi:zinc finger, CCHC-type containing protein [Tanacetum coccineum]